MHYRSSDLYGIGELMNNFNGNIFFYEEYEVYQIVTGNEWKENCYSVVNHSKCEQYIIDPGYDSELIIKEIEINRKYPISYILITHAHHDHVGSAFDLSNYFNVPCIIHPSDKRLLKHAPLYSISFAKRKIRIPDKVIWLDATLEKTLRESGIQILHTPGHTNGSCCILFKNCIFTGDTIFNHTVGRTDLPESNEDQLFNSIEMLTNNYEKLDIFPGHGEKWDMANAKEWWNTCVEKLEYKCFENI
ncbi:MAG TPA: MBL fold metallo-hydrolase [Clostridia bacterium]|nr:MBL fold metallo-hydrolase [Clostridia bacterium]